MDAEETLARAIYERLREQRGEGIHGPQVGARIGDGVLVAGLIDLRRLARELLAEFPEMSHGDEW